VNHEHVATGPTQQSASGVRDGDGLYSEIGDWKPFGGNANPISAALENLLPPSAYGKGGEA